MQICENHLYLEVGRRIPSWRSAGFSLLSRPCGATVALAWVVLKEKISVSQLIGIVLALTAIVMISI